MRTYVENPGSPSAPLVTAVNIARNTVQGMIGNQDEVWRLRFHTLLWMPVEWSTRETRSAMASGAGSRWCTAVVVPFERTLRHRYPFDPRGTMRRWPDVAQFYRPTTGTLWAFYNEQLMNDIPRAGERFTFAERFGDSLSEVYRPEMVEFLGSSNDLSVGAVSALVGRAARRVRSAASPVARHRDHHPRSRRADGGVPQRSGAMSRLRWPGDGGAHGASIRAQGRSG